MIEIILYLTLGSVVGFLSGLLGVGGGGILVPILTGIFAHFNIGESYTVHLAIATSMACTLPITATSTYSHHKKGAVLWPVVKVISLGVMIGSIIGVYIATRVNGIYLAILFTLFMLVTAIKILSNWSPAPTTKPISNKKSGLVGLGIGMLTALISVGGAFFSILYLSAHHVDMKKAIGTSAAVGFISFLITTIGYMLSTIEHVNHLPNSVGYIYLPALAYVTLSSVIMVPMGTHVAHKLPNQTLKKVFGILCILLSIKMLISLF